jgi:foldase protein PrsA
MIMRSVSSAIIVAIVVLALVGCGSKCGDLPGTVATVNGEAISCNDFVGQMNARVGHDILGNIIEQNIIMQWAKKSGVAPTDAQVDQQIELAKDRGQYDDQVKALGEAELRNEMRSFQARANLAKKYIKISDKEIQQAYDSMKTRFVRGPRKYVAAIINSDKAKLEKAEKELKDGKDFDTVAQQYADRRVSPRPPLRVWVVEDQQGMPPAILKAAKDTKVGETSGVVALSQQMGAGTFVILKVIREQGAIDKKLKDVRGEVIDTIALQKSSYDPDFTKKLNEKIKSAKVEVNIPQFKDLVDQYKNMPEATGMMMPPPQ